jgi:hypothetical protein
MAKGFDAILKLDFSKYEMTAIQEINQQHFVESWPGKRLQTLVIAILATLLVVGPAIILETVSPTYPWRWLLLIAFAFALEASLTTIWLRQGSQRVGGFKIRAAEIILLIVILRLITWILSGGFPSVEDFRDYLVSPLQLFDFFFVVSVICTVFAWDRANAFSSIFADLAIKEDEIEYFASQNQPGKEYGYITIAPVDRSSLVKSYYQEWMIGGIVLGISAALTTVRLPELGQAGFSSDAIRNVTRLGMPPQIMFALIVYVIAGLWLGSQARFAAARGRWLMDGIKPDAVLYRNWQRFSIFLLLLLAFAAAFLPIGSTLAISQIIQIVLSVIFGIIILIIVGLIYIIRLVASRLFGATPQEQIPFEFVTPQLPEPGQIMTQSTGIPGQVFGILFWIVILTAIGLSLWYFLRNRGLGMNFQGPRDLLFRILNWIQIHFDNARGRIINFGHRVRESMKSPLRITTPSSKIYSRFRFHSLNPRDQIRYFYLSLVKRAGKHGVPREADSTPLEYLEELKANWSDAADELDTLTQSFQRARYSPQEVNDKEVRAAKKIWERVRTQIRKGLED